MGESELSFRSKEGDQRRENGGKVCGRRDLRDGGGKGVNGNRTWVFYALKADKAELEGLGGEGWRRTLGSKGRGSGQRIRQFTDLTQRLWEKKDGKTDNARREPSKQPMYIRDLST